MPYELAFLYYTFSTNCTVVTNRLQIKLVACKYATVLTIADNARGRGLSTYIHLENTRVCAIAKRQRYTEKICLFGRFSPSMLYILQFTMLQFPVSLLGCRYYDRHTTRRRLVSSGLGWTILCRRSWHVCFNPAVQFSNVSVHSVVLASTTPSPAGCAYEIPAVVLFTNKGTSTIPLTGINSSP